LSFGKIPRDLNGKMWESDEKKKIKRIALPKNKIARIFYKTTTEFLKPARTVELYAAIQIGPLCPTGLDRR